MRVCGRKSKGGGGPSCGEDCHRELVEEICQARDTTSTKFGEEPKRYGSQCYVVVSINVILAKGVPARNHGGAI